MAEQLPKASVELVRRALSAGADAGRVIVEAGHQAIAHGVTDYVEQMPRADNPADIDSLVGRVVKAHVLLARGEGAAAGLVTSVAEATTLVGSAGTLTIPSMVVITATDLTGLLWIQLRMVLTIAALHGHDPTHKARIHEFMSLQGATPASAAPAMAAPLAQGAGRITTRLVQRHLRGPLLVSVTALFRAVGIKFSRAALLRQVFLFNIPMNALVNSTVTKGLAKRSQRFYATLPSAGAPPRSSSA